MCTMFDVLLTYEGSFIKYIIIQLTFLIIVREFTCIYDYIIALIVQ